MKQTIAVAALLGQISAVDLLKHHKRQQKHDNIPAIEATWDRGTTGDSMMPATLLQMRKGDNISGLEIMANGTPEVFPLRGNAKKIEDTWVRGTTNSAMVPASLSSPPASKSDLQLQGDWSTYTGPIPATWVRGTTNASMVTEPPVPKLPQQAPPKSEAIQLDGDWSTYSGPMEATWVRGTTNSAMVTEPPVPTLKGKQAPPKSEAIQLDGDWNTYNGPVEDTWVRGTTNDAMVPPGLSFPPVPKAAKVAAPAKAAAKSLVPKPEKQIDEVPADKAAIQISQLEFKEKVPVEDTWVRGTTNSSMVDETPAPKAGDKTAKKAANAAKKADKAAETAPAKEEAPEKEAAKEEAPEKKAAKEEAPEKEADIQIQDNQAGFETIANGSAVSFELRKSPRTIEQTWERGTTNASMVTEPAPFNKQKDEKEDDRSKEEKAEDAKKAAAAPAKDAAPATDAAPAKDAAPATDAKVQLGDNESGLELMANGTAEVFPLRGNPKAITATWERGTTNMVDPDGKVADIARTMVNNPDKSRSAWAQTRAESREAAAAQHVWEMTSNRDTTASQNKYAKESFDKIFKNEKIRDAGMKEFLIDPTTTNQAPFAKGFGEQDLADKLPKEDKPEAKEDIALYEAPGQANISFQRDSKIARAVAAEQQKQEAEWLNEHKAATAAIQAKTMAKKDRNFIDREGVYQNNWHRPLSSYAQVTAAPRSQADVTFQTGIVEARAVAAEQQKYEADWINEHKASTATTQAKTDAKKWKNFQDREEVQYNNWHLRQGQI